MPILKNCSFVCLFVVCLFVCLIDCLFGLTRIRCLFVQTISVGTDGALIGTDFLTEKLWMDQTFETEFTCIAARSSGDVVALGSTGAAILYDPRAQQSVALLPAADGWGT